MTPDETCAECGGYYLDCNHRSGTLASPLVAALPKKDAAERKVEHSSGCHNNPCVCYLSLIPENQRYWLGLVEDGLCGNVGRKWYLGLSPEEAIAGYPDLGACIEDLFLKQPRPLIEKLSVLIREAHAAKETAARTPQTEDYEGYMSGVDDDAVVLPTRQAFEIEEDL